LTLTCEFCSKFFGQANGAKAKAAPPQQTKLSFSTKSPNGAKKDGPTEERGERPVKEVADEVDADKVDSEEGKLGMAVRVRGKKG
jgi:hypothetical protein